LAPRCRNHSPAFAHTLPAGCSPSGRNRGLDALLMGWAMAGPGTWLPVTLVSSLTWKSPSPASAGCPPACGHLQQGARHSTGPANTLAQAGAAPCAVTRCHTTDDVPVPKILPESHRGCPVPLRLELTGRRRPKMPPGIAVRPRAHRAASPMDITHGFPRALPRPPAPSPAPAPGSGTGKALAVPPSPYAASHQRSHVPRQNQPPPSPTKGFGPGFAARQQLSPSPLVPRVGCPLCTPLGANAGDRNPLPGDTWPRQDGEGRASCWDGGLL